MMAWVLLLCGMVWAQEGTRRPVLGDAAAVRARARRFLAERRVQPDASGATVSAAEAMLRARTAAASLPRAGGLRPHGLSTNLTAPWQPMGPVAVNSLSYGEITGRVNAVAVDPNDSTGNTVWLGTAGGGVWKSTTAAGPLGSVRFAPLTDDLTVFSANEGALRVPALSIGAVAVQPASTAVVLAGTGDPNGATDSYYGEGILRSADGGQTWTLAIGSQDGAAGSHNFAGLATAGLAWSSTTPTLAVAAMSVTAESVAVGAVPASSVPGLYFSVDAGVTWQMATVYDGTQVVQRPEPAGFTQAANAATAVVWDARRQMFFAALSGHGYYGSADGQTWTRLPQQPGAGLTTANCPVGANGTGAATCPMLRGALAVQPVTGDLYALTVDSAEGDQGLWQDLCQANAAGVCASALPTFVNRVDHGALESGQGAAGGATTVPQGSYDLTLAAAPAAGGGTVLFAGTVDLYRCSMAAGASACVLRNTTNAGDGCNAPAGVAPAQHTLAVYAQTSGVPLLWIGNDGGLWRSVDGVAETGAVCSASDASHFDDVNGGVAQGGSLAEVVGLAQDLQSADTMLAGLGALGSAATTAASGMTAWPQMSEGEGGYPQLDPVTPDNWYVAVGAGVDLTLCARGTNCAAADFLGGPTIGEAQVGYDAALLDGTTMLDPQATGNLLVGTCRVWRGPAANGSTWSNANALSPAMDGSATPCSGTSALIRSLGAGGPVATTGGAAGEGSAVLYAGMAGAADGGGALGGHVFVTTAANTATSSRPWTDVTASPVANSSLPFNGAGLSVSAVVVDKHDATGGTVYVTLMGFGTGVSTAHVYRSTDFGAHWTDLTANLPNAPANALLVDPNDANTVYVAMDAGVFATQAISTCATANCWGMLGTGLPNAPVTALAAGAALPTGDGRLGMLRAGTYGRGVWQTPLLTAVNAAQPKLVASPSALSFGVQAVGTASAGQTITLTSSGNAPAVVSSVVVAGDFTETDTCSGQTVAVGSTCSVAVRFTPTATGSRTGLLTVYGNVSGGQVTVALSGMATAPAAVVLTPLGLQFPSTTVNQTSATEIVTVSNTGGMAATLGAISASGDFAVVQNTCGASLAGQTGCSVVVEFTPTASGTRTGVLTVVDSVGTQTAQLSGTGQSPATDTLSPLSLSFAAQQTGTVSGTQQVVLTNAGDVALTLIAGAITSGDFTVANSCGASLAAHSSCAMSVTFVPTATGLRTGTLTVTDAVRTQTVALMGTGVAPPGVSLTPANVGFGSMGVGLNSPPQTVTLTNNGGLPLTLTGAAVQGDFAVASTSCGSSLSAGASCTYLLFFAPSAAGARAGTLTLTDNAPSGTQVVNLSGTGVDFALAANGATAVTVTAGGTATFPMQLSSVGGLSGNVALSCAGAPANSQCTVTPSAGALGGTVLVSVVVQTTAAVAALLPLPGRGAGAGRAVWLAFAPVLWLAVRRRRRVLAKGLWLCLVVMMASAAVLGLSGCGANRLLPLSGAAGSTSGTATAPTPAGVYPITVTGATAGVTHAVTVSLTVQ